ncbi:MAG: regulatory protein RecX [Lachnospiraceae bacterium]|nr:regulatory protein RecX [Lachnospiraceae bacterium]
MNNSKAKYTAFDTAVYLLTYKNRTVKEIEDKLKSKGYSETEIDKAVKKLKEYSFVDDENYTLLYIKSNLDKKGEKLIRRELEQKGIERELIRTKIDELEISEKEEEKIEAIFNKRFINMNLDDIKIQNKI